METLLTTEDVAEFFRMDVATVRRMIGKRELTAYRVGGEYRFRRADIDAYLERQKLPAEEESGRHGGKLPRRVRSLIGAGSGSGSKDCSDTSSFDHFTERAARVMALAQEEAQRLSHDYIGTEHLLLGLIAEGEGVAAKVLSNFGIDVTKVRSAVEGIIGRGNNQKRGEVHLTPRAKKVIELAVDEARRLGHHFVGTEHLLLGLIREGEGIAAGVLESLGVNLEKVRSEVIKVLTGTAASARD
jgi:excisionase family DNA binding protein